MWPFDQNNQQMYQQYSQAYDTGNYNGVDQNQAFGNIQQFVQGAPYDLQQQIYQQHFAQMPYEQRALLAQRVPPQYGMDINNPASMSQSFLRMGQEQPGLLREVFNHPFLVGSGLALAGLVAKHMIDRHRAEYGYQNQGFANQGGYYNQGGFNSGYGQDPYIQQEINHERREERELRSELRREEREVERLEEHEHHHHRRDDYY